MVKLNTHDWIVAGFKALTIGGPEAIKVEPIAKVLKVSKGSFYWHFKDLAAYKTAMLEQWQRGATHNIVSQISGLDAPARDQLVALIKSATTDEKTQYGGHMAEAAIRDWARYNPEVSTIVTEMDRTRVGFVHRLFQNHGLSAPLAKQSANVLYAALLGLDHLAVARLAIPAQDLMALLLLLLDQTESGTDSST